MKIFKDKCPYCKKKLEANNRATLNHNLETHIKVKHPEYYTNSREGRVIPSTSPKTSGKGERLANKGVGRGIPTPSNSKEAKK